MNLDPFSAMPEHFDLHAMRTQVEAMPETGKLWANPASLARLGYTSMPHKMFTRFCKYVKPFDYGHRPGQESRWDGFNLPCWLWTGGLHDEGYGRFYLGKDGEKKVWSYPHRISFEHWVAAPKAGYVVDHECNVKTCVNPTHLWPITNNENLRLADQRRPWVRRNQYSKE